MAKRNLPKLERRSKPTAEPRQQITIYCEGRRTEPEYINAFALDVRNQLVQVRVVGGIGVPKTIVQRAIKEKPKSRKQASFEANDQIWVVFDRDDHKCVEEAFELARRHQIHVAYSNPCFELWALLHFRDHGKQINSAEAQRLLKEEMPTYEKKGNKAFDYQSMRAGYALACRRAAQLQRDRSQDGSNRGTPYTDVDKLMALISGNGKRR